MKATFLRALEETEDKSRVLREAITSPKPAMGRTLFEVDPATFRQVPRSPFAYWISDRVRAIFTKLPPFKSDERAVKQGLATTDDFRFVRVWTEVGAGTMAKRWFPFAKGGTFSRFYSDVDLVVNWEKGGREMYAFNGIPYGTSGAPMRNPQFYFRPGLTWPLRGVRFSSQAVPSGCVFSVAGKMAFTPDDELPWMHGLFNSRPFDSLIAIFAGKVGGVQYEVGLLQHIPVPLEVGRCKDLLEGGSLRAWSLKHSLDTRTETSHAFYLPAILQVGGHTFSDRSIAWGQRVTDTKAELAHLQAEIDDRCFELYGIDGADREQIERGLGSVSVEGEAEGGEEEGEVAEELAAAPLVASLLSWFVGVVFGRFDLRLATGERSDPPEPEPFDPLPVCSQGMLTGEDGLPPDAPPAGYAIDFPRDGILVDDAGSPRDLVAAVRQVFESVFDDPAACWEEAAEILGERDRTLRRWFARDYFGFHLKQYSKSRRKAPIYWPLSTASGSYTVWIYYHRLTTDTLFQVVVEQLDPKIRKVQEERLQIAGRLEKAGGREAAKLAKQAGELAELEQELEEMKAELLRVAELPYKPDLNDGVQITAAPLWKLFRLPAWRKVLETTWKKLEKGEYVWAHLAYAIWPDRVRDKCKMDRSLAIAHHLEGLYDVAAARELRGQ